VALLADRVDVRLHPHRGGLGARPPETNDERRVLALFTSTRHPERVGDKPPIWNPAARLAALRAVVAKLPKLADPVAERPRTEAPRQARQLKGDRAAALVSDYSAGASIKEVTERYGVHRLTAYKIIERHGVAIRKRRLTEDEIELAVRLYEQGMSQARIAEQIGASSDGVRYQLLKRGIKMRSPHEWRDLP
jgi:predicted HTH domain antitoxin